MVPVILAVLGVAPDMEAVAGAVPDTLDVAVLNVDV
jgi:hypothetical protein